MMKSRTLGPRVLRGETGCPFICGPPQCTTVMTEIEIEFCVPCGLYSYATEVQDAVIEEYGEGIDRVVLTTGDGGVFKIYADGDIIWDKSISEDGLDHDEILADVGEYVGREA